MRFNKSDLIYLAGNLSDYGLYPDKYVDVWYFSKVRNIGDLIGPYMLEKLTGKTARKNIFGISSHYLTVGSILDQATTASHVWGSGFLRSTDRLTCSPAGIDLVRGEYSKLKLGIDNTIPVGDPGLALAEFYQPKVSQKYKIGLVLHYSDFSELEFLDDNVKVIRVDQSLELFVDAVLECGCILSSSLHGLIVAEAYGVPNAWIKLASSRRSDDFKYYDYYSVFHEALVEPSCIEVLDSRNLNVAALNCRTRKIKPVVRAILSSFNLYA